MNKVILMGRLTRDPDIRYSQGPDQMAIARYTLAVDRRVKTEGGQNADFISCVAFSKLADFAEKYLKQGIKIVVEGRIQTGSYTNKDGQRVYTTEVVVENCEFAESKGESSSRGSSPEQTAGTAPDGFMNIPDGAEPLPFS
ncbi:MAG: single-stranded DNA-binding protein [Lachnospiraceae bacterium]|nr:single-stranded DNA-binding protein [Lachnospiraceae bacterium]